MLQTRFPRPRGDIGHPQSLSLPVRHRVVVGATPERIVRGRDPVAIAPFVEAGRALVAEEGVAAIATSCGFLALWQRELQAALPVPVWTSSLLQLGQELRGRRCGVITIEAASLTADHFGAVGADPATPVEGVTPGSPLHRTLLEDRATLDTDDAARQVVAAGQRLCARHPALDALVLECTNLPPYAAALARATGRPVYDVLTMIETRWHSLAAAAPPP